MPQDVNSHWNSTLCFCSYRDADLLCRLLCLRRKLMLSHCSAFLCIVQYSIWALVGSRDAVWVCSSGKYTQRIWWGAGLQQRCAARNRTLCAHVCYLRRPLSTLLLQLPQKGRQKGSYQVKSSYCFFTSFGTCFHWESDSTYYQNVCSVSLSAQEC